MGTGLHFSRLTMLATDWKKSAPTLSILLIKQILGTPYLSAWRHTVSVCG